MDSDSKHSYMIGTEGCSEVIRHIREQRHDFSNHIQAIWGYLQLGYVDKAQEYIHELNKKSVAISCLLKIDDPELSLLLYDNAKQAMRCGIDVNVEIDGEWESNGILNSARKQKLHIIDLLFKEILDRTSPENVIYIDIFCEDNMSYIILTNNHMVDYSEVEENNLDGLRPETIYAAATAKIYGVSIGCSKVIGMTFKVGIPDS